MRFSFFCRIRFFGDNLFILNFLKMVASASPYIPTSPNSEAEMISAGSASEKAKHRRQVIFIILSL